MKSRRLLAPVVLAAVVPLLAACFLPSFGPSTETSTPTGESVEARYEPYYSQVLTWTPCNDGFQCATAIAPMDWQNPSSETDIELALVRRSADGTARGSLFMNPGGPGASGIDLVLNGYGSSYSKALAAQYDVIGWDPRGVGKSTAVQCLDDAGLDDYLFGIPTGAVGSQEWTDQVVQSGIDFGQACLQNTGPLLQFVDTRSTVKDLDMLRAVVGDEKLNYFGYSYGSDIGSIYVDEFPTKTGRVVLDGATDSSISVFDVGLVQTRGFQRALENYLAACPGMFQDCPFTGDIPTDLATVRSLYDRYDASPIPAADGRLMDAGVIDTAMSMALYSQDSWPFLNDLFSEAQKGVTDTAFFLADYYYSRDSSGRYADNSFQAFTAIYCVDYPVERDPAVLAEQSRLLQEASPTTYRPAPPMVDPTCGNWPFQYTGPAIEPLTGAGAPPVLIVSTTGDPATPYEWGVALSEQLQSGQLVTFNGEGHTAYGQSQCVADVVDAYFVDDVVPSTDPNC